MYEPMPGFNRAQYDYENQEPPYDDGCVCPLVFECDECSAEYETKPEKCTTIDCTGDIEEVERRDDHLNAVQSCDYHGWCTGCFSKWCEDCNG